MILNYKIQPNLRNVLNSINNLKLFEEEIKKIKSFGKISKDRLQRANENWKII